VQDHDYMCNTSIITLIQEAPPLHYYMSVFSKKFISISSKTVVLNWE